MKLLVDRHHVEDSTALPQSLEPLLDLVQPLHVPIRPALGGFPGRQAEQDLLRGQKGPDAFEADGRHDRAAVGQRLDQAARAEPDQRGPDRRPRHDVLPGELRLIQHGARLDLQGEDRPTQGIVDVARTRALGLPAPRVIGRRMGRRVRFRNRCHGRESRTGPK